MTDIIQDVSALSGVGVYNLNNLIDKATGCICHSIAEDLLNGAEMTSVDIGIGILKIRKEGSEIYYKFIPSTKLEKKVSKTFLTGKSPVTLEAEAELGMRIDKMSKDLF